MVQKLASLTSIFARDEVGLAQHPHAAIRHIFQVADRRRDNVKGTGVIQLSHVSKEYDGKRRVVALDSIDLQIVRGEMVGIVGPSGSGKSTLLNLIGGLDRPTSGEVVIDGARLSGLSDDALTRVRRDKIGFIFQFFNLLPTLSCLENVAIPLHLRGWPRKRIEERVKELLNLVGLGARIDHLPDELSGGERQRVAIARALAVYPPILLADEPTGNLDTHTGQEILALIRDVHQRLNCTVLIVTHDQAVSESCPRLVSLRDGRIVEDRAGAAARSIEEPVATIDPHEN